MVGWNLLGAGMLDHILLCQLLFQPFADAKADAVTAFATARTGFFNFRQVIFHPFMRKVLRKPSTTMCLLSLEQL